jgi:hypothetical protein
MIVSQSGIDRDGTSRGWEFFFDLPDRRAQLARDWAVAPEADPAARVQLVARPFPPADSPLRQMVREGRMLRQQLAGMWRRELRRRPDVPAGFRDTPVVAGELAGLGLDLDLEEFSLGTGQAPDGRPAWVAQARRDTYYVALS